MAHYENFYEGSDIGLDPNYGFTTGYHLPASQIGLATDARTANQLKATSEKISAGAGTIEVQGTFPQVGEAIPDQHLEEINKLKKLTGVDLTFHGPLVEPTGVDPQGRRWEESLRMQAENQMWKGVERAHKLEPDGNIVVTLHTSNGLPEPSTHVIDEKTGKKIHTGLAVVDERTGNFGPLPKPKAEHLLKEPADPVLELKRMNEENWSTSLSNLNLDIERAKDSFERSGGDIQENLKKAGVDNPINQIYKLSREEPDKFKNYIQSLGDVGQLVSQQIDGLNYGGVFVHDAYIRFRELFNQAYDSAKRDKDEELRKKLEKYRDEVYPSIKAYRADNSKIIELNSAVEKGIKVLGTITPPEIYKPLEEFAVDKASDTFSNIAIKSYDKFGETAPILSLENPPAGSGLSKGEEIKKLVEASRDKFVQKAQSELGMSESKARAQAEKLIGVTWDVGHINMLRKYGYGDKEIVEETKHIAPLVKHVHLSDNFGMEHTELPMGMGNVPTKKHLELIGQYNKQAKKIVETGDWYQHFQTTPFAETLTAFGSPVFANAGPTAYWHQQRAQFGDYFSGYGQMLPDTHFSVYGAGWSGLPPELGGQMSGRSRLSGAPME